MIDDPEIKAEHGISSSTLKAFWNWCVDTDADNSGEYRARLDNGMSLRDAIPARLRKNIVFYTTGCGWRVRKKPHWKTVFAERFPVHYARFTAKDNS